MSNPAIDRRFTSGSRPASNAVTRLKAAEPGYQAFLLLRLAFAVAPIAFGADKFANVMVHWPKYLGAGAARPPAHRPLGG